MPLYPFIFPHRKRVLDVYLLNQSSQIFTSPRSFKDSCCLASKSTTIYYKSHQISSPLLKTLKDVYQHLLNTKCPFGTAAAAKNKRRTEVFG